MGLVDIHFRREEVGHVGVVHAEAAERRDVDEAISYEIARPRALRPKPVLVNQRDADLHDHDDEKRDGREQHEPVEEAVDHASMSDTVGPV